MDVGKLIYKKSAGTTSARNVQKINKTISESVVPAADVSVPTIPYSTYLKDDAAISTAIVFVLSGGERREKDYFKIIGNLKRIVVAFKSKKNEGLKPLELDAIAKEFLRKHQFETDIRTYNINDEDILYILQDVDEFAEDIKKILQDKSSKQIQWLISNPCFEIWLYYHYKDENPQIVLSEIKSLSTAKRSQWLKNELNKIIQGGINPSKALEHLPKAIERSKKYYSEKDGIPLLYATQMDKLGEHIIALDKNNEIEAYFQALHAKQEQWKAMMPTMQSLYKKLSGKKINDLIHSLCVWDNNYSLQLPMYDSTNAIKGQTIIDNRAFVANYKIEKKYLDDTSNAVVGNADDLFMMHIHKDVKNYYFTQLILHNPIKTYNIDYMHIEDAIKRLELNVEYSILTTVPLSRTIIPSYYIGRGFDESIYIMHNDYVPLVSWKQYEGSNPEFKDIQEGSKIYSNFHQVKNYEDGYGVSIMRVGKFMLPPSGSFRMICLKLVGYKSENNESDKLSIRDTILLQYEEGDFVLYQGIICQIENILNDGFIKLKYVDNNQCIQDIQPVPVDGVYDRQIYYDPIVAAPIIRIDDPVPVHKTDYSYYMDHFRKEMWPAENTTTWDKVNVCHFRYLHEIQHWLRAEMGQDGLRIHWDEEMKLITKTTNKKI